MRTVDENQEELMPELRELSDAELNAVSGGQQNSLTATLVATLCIKVAKRSRSFCQRLGQWGRAIAHHN
jgi:bacteriocin-like protein